MEEWKRSEEVWLIKKLLNSKMYKEGRLTQKDISKMFNVCQTTISKIKLNKTWKHVKFKE